MENPSTQKFTATETLPPATSQTSGYIIWEYIVGEERGFPAQNLALFLELFGPPAQPTLVRTRRADEPIAATPSSRSAILSQRYRQDSELDTPSDRSDGLVALTSERDHVAAELGRERLGNDNDPASKDRVLIGQKSADSCAALWRLDATQRGHLIHSVCRVGQT